MAQAIEIPSAAFTAAVTGRNAEDGNSLRAEFLHHVAPELDPHFQWEKAQAAQVQELHLIRTQADLIEQEFTGRGLPFPNVFVYYTAGFNAPSSVQNLGVYGEENGPFQFFQPADISGHLGNAAALPVSEEDSALLFFGRAHPYSGVGQQFAELTYARPFNVIKELMRRQRERGKQSAVILTYLTGVDETSPLRPGDLGIIIDHTEAAGGRAGLSAGAGPRNLLDRFLGERFQPKLGRASDTHLAREFYKIALESDVHVGPVATIGTFGTTSYQGQLDRGLALAGFHEVEDVLNDQADLTLQVNVPVSLFYDMALSFEADVLRQTIVRHHTNGRNHWFEQDFPILQVALPTDIVGSGSADVDHAAIVAEAFKHGARNGKLIFDLVHQISPALNETHPLTDIPAWVNSAMSLGNLLPQA